MGVFCKSSADFRKIQGNPEKKKTELAKKNTGTYKKIQRIQEKKAK